MGGGFIYRMGRSVAASAKALFRGTLLERKHVRSAGKYLFLGWPPALGDIRFGDLAALRPASTIDEYDRGSKLDRYYVEAFLDRHRADVKGHVLEVSEDVYSRRFGGSAITRQDVIHLDSPEPPVTIVGDLTRADVLPDNTFDCIIITQTLQYIMNLDDAVMRLHAALKPGGVLLATVPGITQLEAGDPGEAWCWSFTRRSIRQLFAKVFAADAIEVTTYGNCFAAVAFLFGAALEEIDLRKLDPVDITYPVVLTLRVQKHPC